MKDVILYIRKSTDGAESEINLSDQLKAIFESHRRIRLSEAIKRGIALKKKGIKK